MKTEWIQLETEGDNMILRKLSKNPDKLTWPSKGVCLDHIWTYFLAGPSRAEWWTLHEGKLLVKVPTHDI